MNEPFVRGELDVVVADDEDICRYSAVSALELFGFQRVHEVESGDEAFLLVTSLQSAKGAVAPRPSSGGQERSVPIIVFLDLRMPGSDGLDCAKRICTLFAEGRLPREPFLVCASARRIEHSSNNNNSKFHCSIPKTWESSKIAEVFEFCQQWWLRGGGEPGAKPKPRALVPIQPPVQKVIEPPLSFEIPYSSPPVVATPTPTSSTTPSAAGATDGHSLQSLANLLPAKPPFEDIEMIHLVARGSFGRVYNAKWDVSTVALKVVEQFEPNNRAKMAFEGVLSASLAHPNLVQTFKHSIRDLSQAGKGSVATGFEIWIVQEWCDQGTLHNKIISGQILEQGGFDEIIDVAAEIASAASYLNNRGIIHGDLTAKNVLLLGRTCTKGYITKVADFGLARVLEAGMTGIDTTTLGTVTHMPPELFSIEGSALTKKVDIYAFGVIAWQLCTSRLPWDNLQPTQVVVMVSRGGKLELPAGVPEPLRHVVNTAMARDPADRPAFDKIVQDLVRMSRPEYERRLNGEVGDSRNVTDPPSSFSRSTTA